METLAYESDLVTLTLTKGQLRETAQALRTAAYLAAQHAEDCEKAGNVDAAKRVRACEDFRDAIADVLFGALRLASADAR